MGQSVELVSGGICSPRIDDMIALVAKAIDTMAKDIGVMWGAGVL
ncbi:MAG: hypothetical protein ABFS30_01785 [Pseudomonadota bacterium]